MNVLHICSNYTDTLLYQKLNEELQKNGINQTYIVPNSFSSNCKFDLMNNVKVLKCYPTWLRVAYRLKQLVIKRAVKNAVDVSEYDVVHAHLLFTNGYLAYRIKKEYGIPYVVAVRNTDVNAFFKYMKHLRPLGVRIMENADRIIFLSKAYFEQVKEKYIPESFMKEFITKSIVIPNGIDKYWLDNIHYKNARIEKPVVKLVYAGRIDKNKNIGATVRAMALLENKGIEAHLDVVGNVEDKSEYERIINNDRITYFAPMKKEQLIEIYRKNDVFIMPSFHETFGLVYAEAMSQGLPVIYTKGEGFDGQFENGFIGYSVNPNSPEMIAEVIEKIINDYKIMSQNCIKSVACFDWEIISKQYNEVYYSIKNEVK